MVRTLQKTYCLRQKREVGEAVYVGITNIKAWME